MWVQPDFIVKLFFEIAVDQQIRTSDQTFLRGSHIWFIFCPIMQNHCKISKTTILGALLVAIDLLNSYMNFHLDWTKMAD